MFGFKKNSKEKRANSGIPDDIYEFLLEADRLYIKAFETRSVGLLREFFTRDCIFSLGNWIANEASSRYFADEQFRDTSFELLSSSGQNIRVRKTCIYKDIRLTLSRTMKVSEDYMEDWVLNITPNEIWVQSIEPVKERRI